VGINSATALYLYVDSTSDKGAYIAAPSGAKALLVQDEDVGIGTVAPDERLDVNGNIKASGSVQVANNTDAASASNVGAIRYRTSGNNSYVDICMQNGASSYTWENIASKSW
jgi:hypothetical protein